MKTIPDKMDPTGKIYCEGDRALARVAERGCLHPWRHSKAVWMWFWEITLDGPA